MDPKLLPQEFRKPYLHLLISRLSVETIPAGTPEGQGIGFALDWLIGLKDRPSGLREDLEKAAATRDPLLTELAAATSRERGTLCSFGEAAKIAYDQLQAREEQKHPWKKLLREAKEAKLGSK